MIKINKFENIYGIKKLIGANNLKKNSVIYAPNGTAKSSIADALEILSDDMRSINEVTDVYHNLPAPTFEIDVDGNLCTETKRLPFKVIKYSGVNDFEILKNNNIGNIVMSPNVIKLISSNLKIIEKSTQTIKSLIDNQFPKNNKKPEYLPMLALLADTYENDPELYLKLVQNVDLTASPLSIAVDEKMLLNIVNSKTRDACQNPSVVSGVSQYISIVNNPTLKSGRPSYLDDDFTLEKLQDLHKNAIKNKFYSTTNPERKIYLDRIAYDESGIDNEINNEINRIYGSSQAKAQMDDIKKSFTGKKASFDTFKTNPVLVTKINNYSLMANELFVTLISPVINSIIIELNNIKKAQTIISTVQKSYNPSDNKLSEIWKKFESRFKFKKFDLRIDNEFNAVIGKEVPVFAKYIPGTNTKVTNPKDLRFSTGEIRTFNLINFIISVETLVQNNDVFTIVLDDAVDSFDYKNKYGIIDYLNDIKDNQNVQLLILTHNFDFYRSSILALGSRNSIGQYFAYRNSNNEIEFYDTSSNGYLLQMVDFNNWKNAPTEAKYYALIPFSRNVIQLGANSSNPAVVSIDEFIHYDINLEGKVLNDVNAILKPNMNINMPSSISGNEKYLFEINRLIEEILNGNQVVNETDLEYKIMLGLYIRLFLERFLFLNYKRYSGVNPTVTKKYTRTYELINLNKNNNYINNSDFKEIIEANVISPAFAHFNSFMYEPLIDVGVAELENVAKWIHDKNLTWPL